MVFLKKLYQRKERKASVSSTSAKIHSRHAKDGEGHLKFVSSSDLQAHASVSPYYARRSSHASPTVYLKYVLGTDATILPTLS